MLVVTLCCSFENCYRRGDTKQTGCGIFLRHFLKLRVNL